MKKKLIILLLAFTCLNQISIAQNKEWKNALFIQIEDAQILTKRMSGKGNTITTNLRTTIDEKTLSEKEWLQALMENDGQELKAQMKAIYEELGQKSSANKVILLCPEMLITENEILANVFLKQLKVPALSLINAGELAALTLNMNRGLVIYLGEADIVLTKVSEEIMQGATIGSLGMSGDDISNYLIKQLGDRGINLGDSALGTAREIRNNYCYVAENVETEFKNMIENPGDWERSYSLNEETEISISKERFLSTEIIFNPGLFQKSGLGIDFMVMEALHNLEPDMNKESIANILLFGPLRNLQGLDGRLKAKLLAMTELKTGNIKINVVENLADELGNDDLLQKIYDQAVTAEVFKSEGFKAFK